MEFLTRNFFYTVLVLLLTFSSISLFADRNNRPYRRGHDSNYDDLYTRNYYGHYQGWGGWNDRYWGAGKNFGVGTRSYYRPRYVNYDYAPYGYRRYAYPVDPIYDFDTTYYFVIPR